MNVRNVFVRCTGLGTLLVALGVLCLPMAVQAEEAAVAKQTAVQAHRVVGTVEDTNTEFAELQKVSREAAVPALPSGQTVVTPEGHMVPVYRAVRETGQAAASGDLRAGIETVLYKATAVAFFGTADWYMAYDLASTETAPYGISYISAFSGDAGSVNYWCTRDRFHLIEVYDTHLCDIPANPGTCTPQCGVNTVQSGYLGGLIVNLGPHAAADPICGGATGSNQDFFRWFVEAAATEVFPFYTSDDGIVTFVHRLGEVAGGVFVPEPAFTNPTNISLIFSTEGTGARDTVGARVGGSFYSDGFGGGDQNDRIYTPDDGPLAFGGTDPGVLDFEVRGRVMNDCNGNNVPDLWEIICFDNPDGGADLDCPVGFCEYYVDFDTNGKIWNSPIFRNPLSGANCETECVQGFEDANTDGVLDQCLEADCDTNGIPDICDLDCNALNPFTSALCSVDFPGTCGTGTDCNGNGTLDVCEIAGRDCNGNGILDSCDIGAGTSSDCNAEGTPDECELAAGAEDCDNNSVIDRCERPLFFDCNRNGVEDYCDILNGDANDFNANGVPDECPAVTCTPIWMSFDQDANPATPLGGFEDGIFVLGAPLHQLDAEPDGGSGDTFFDTGATAWTTVAGGLANNDVSCSGTSPKAIRAAGTSAAAGFNNFLFSEYFISTGFQLFPPPTPTQSVHFDYQISAGLNTAGFDFHIQLDGGQNLQTFGYFIRLTSTQSDLNTNGTANPADDVTPGQIWYFDPIALDADGVPGRFFDTGVVVNTSCHHIELRLDNSTGTADILHDGVVIANDISPVEPLNRIDFFGAGSITHLTPTGASTPTLTVDNWEVCVTGGGIDCSEYQLPGGGTGTDCDGNFICDHFELAGNDTNNNGVLDHCEGYCPDCNNNYIDDGYEIDQGWAPDANANRIIDWCEGTDHDQSFEGFTVGANAIGRRFRDGAIQGAGGQLGWTEYNSETEVSATAASSFPTHGTKYIRVLDTNNSGATWVLSPRLNNAGDGDIELWAWDMRATAQDFGALFVEVSDMCADGPAVKGDGTFIFVGDFNNAANVGISWDSDDGDLTAAQVRMKYLQDPGAQGFNRSYENADQGDASNPTTVGTQILVKRSAGLYVNNKRGQYNGYWAAAQTGLVADANRVSSGGAGETQRLERKTVGGSAAGDPGVDVQQGGDRQLAIRTTGGFGAGGTTQFWFDAINYSTFRDCDADGVDDAAVIAAFPAIDANADGILDSCQDCDNDCPAGVFDILTGTGVGAANRGCLDPCEINAAAPGCGGLGGGSADCNANGIPDSCDINQNLPAQWMYHSACFGTGPNFQGLNGVEPGRCVEYWAGGGSLDCNGNSIPDECDGIDRDCNDNGICDAAEIAGGTCPDADGNGACDECDPDCNNNGVPDAADRLAGPPVGCQDAINNVTGAIGPDLVCDECCNYSPNGDMDGDTDADEADYAAMQACAGPVVGSYVGLTPQPQCGCADLNGDGVVDDSDVQIFTQIITGPQ